MARINPDEGRGLFGEQAEAYYQYRPEYPERIFDLLQNEVDFNIRPTTLEIGAGTGLATQKLLALGANPYVVIEPDARFNPYLKKLSGSIKIMNQPFEEAAQENGRFDLAVSATAFHWVDPAVGLQKVGQLLKPNGVWGMWWHIFGDPKESDAFHQATQPLFDTLSSSPSTGKQAHFALETKKRFAEIEATGLFKRPFFEAIPWTLPLTAEKLRGLYATFSPIQKLEPDKRQMFLDQLSQVVQSQFKGLVEKKMISAIYIARRRSE